MGAESKEGKKGEVGTRAERKSNRSDVAGPDR